MVLKNDMYSVSITYGLSYSYHSADNFPYDKFIEAVEPGDFTKTLLLSVNNSNNPVEETKVGLICPYHTFTENMAIVENNKLWLLLDYVLVCLSLDSFEIIRKAEIEKTIGAYFQLHKHKDSFIVYGEMDIVMLDQEMEEKWRFSGRDIFVRHGGGEAFIMKEDRICLYDFEDNYYEIDYNGNII